MSVIEWAGLAVAVFVAIGILALRRKDHTRRMDEHADPRAGQLDDLNRLLRDGSVTPEEYELLKRRMLAGQVH